MKRALVLLATLFVCAATEAQMAGANPALRSYATKIMPRCPGGVLSVEPIKIELGPANFVAYAVTLRSSDQHCGGQKYLLHSPKTNQVVVGAVIQIPQDARPLTTRIAAESTRMLGKEVTATLAPFPVQDGLKAVTITRQTPYGPFSYHGFVDASEMFLIVGSRGNLLTDPTQALRDTLGAKTGAVRKGNAAAKVEIIELSDFQCPTCARAHVKVDPLVQQNLSKVNYLRVDLPLFEHHEWAIPAAMGARAIQRVAPAKYWAYVDYVFEHQEEIGKQPFDKFFKDYVGDHDMDWKAVERIYMSRVERQALLDQVSKAFSLGIAATPTYIVNGQILGFGPEGKYTIDAIRSALGLPPAPATPAAGAAKKK
jgi:protein-disulfide isomerase